MSIKSKINWNTRQITILDKTIEIQVSDDNLFEQYFDISELQSEWHRKIIGEYHFSALLGCLRSYYFDFQYDFELSPEQKGVFLLGKIIHKLIQEKLERSYGFVVIEHPCVDDLSAEISIIGKVDVIDILKHLEIDIKTQSYVPDILVEYDIAKFEESYGKMLLQILGYAYFLNHTYYECDPLEKLRILLVDKKTLAVKPIQLDYNDEIGEYFYRKIRARANYLHDCLLNNEKPTQIHLDKNCKYCSYNSEELCPEGAELVFSLTPPEIFEVMEYKKKYGDNKRPYWKYDDEQKRWLKSKDFKRFLKEDLGYSDKKFKELP